MRGSLIRCFRKRISQAWLTVSKYDRMSALRTKFTFLMVIPTTRASSAPCWPRFGRNPDENPRKSSSQIAFRTPIVVSGALAPFGRRLDLPSGV